MSKFSLFFKVLGALVAFFFTFYIGAYLFNHVSAFAGIGFAFIMIALIVTIFTLKVKR